MIKHYSFKAKHISFAFHTTWDNHFQDARWISHEGSIMKTLNIKCISRLLGMRKKNPIQSTVSHCYSHLFMRRNEQKLLNTFDRIQSKAIITDPPTQDVYGESHCQIKNTRKVNTTPAAATSSDHTHLWDWGRSGGVATQDMAPETRHPRIHYDRGSQSLQFSSRPLRRTSSHQLVTLLIYQYDCTIHVYIYHVPSKIYKLL